MICNYHYLFSSVFSKEIAVIVSSVVLLVFTFVYLTSPKKTLFSHFCFMLIAIGGLLNVGERMAFGCVKDYLNFFGLFLFNLNDILVTLGLGGFLVQWGNGNTKNL